jgi:hypothetical protein
MLAARRDRLIHVTPCEVVVADDPVVTNDADTAPQ